MIPEEVIEKLKLWCESNDLGLAKVSDPYVRISLILIGPKTFSPDQIAVVVANMLLTGIITGIFSDENDDALDRNINPGSNNKLTN